MLRYQVKNDMVDEMVHGVECLPPLGSRAGSKVLVPTAMVQRVVVATRPLRKT